MKRLFLALAVVAAASTAAAQSLKPGLWEITSRMSGNPKAEQAMAQMEKQMAAMPPEQRKAMQDMMARQGVSIRPGAGGAMVSRVCISKEMLERGHMPVQHDSKARCSHTVVGRSAAGMTMKFSCENPPSSGEGRFTYHGDTAYDMKMNITSNRKGEPTQTTLDTSGKWQGADCGEIKPLQVPAAKP